MVSDNPGTQPVPGRCRLMLVVHCQGDRAQLLAVVESALEGGDVAGVILSPGLSTGGEPEKFSDYCEGIVAVAQSRGIAVMIANDSQIMGRSGADGLHVDTGNQDIKAAVEKFVPGKMIGAGNVKSRHNALVVGEMQPDYLFFGKLKGDTHDEAHPKNLALAEWWASMVEIPCIVMGGRKANSCIAVAKSGAEFVALSSAIFRPDSDDASSAGAQIAKTNALLDRHAPGFEEVE